MGIVGTFLLLSFLTWVGIFACGGAAIILLKGFAKFLLKLFGKDD